MNLTNETLRAINKNLEEHLGLFSESEMERNQKTYCTFRPSDLHYIKEAVEELLQLRSLRDAGDEEVDRMLVGLMHDASLSTGAKETVKILRYIAIARGRTRTDAVNKAAEWAKECEALQAEIERLKRENDTLKEYFPSGAFEAKPQHEEGDGGYYDLFPGGLYQ